MQDQVCFLESPPSFSTEDHFFLAIGVEQNGCDPGWSPKIQMEFSLNSSVFNLSNPVVCSAQCPQAQSILSPVDSDSIPLVSCWGEGMGHYLAVGIGVSTAKGLQMWNRSYCFELCAHPNLPC